MERFISERFGGTVLPSTEATGPLPLAVFSFSMHCFMIRTDWRISSMRIR